MRILVTGSNGHLGEGLARTLRTLSHDVIGFDLVRSPFTSEIGSIVDRSHVKRCMEGVDAVIHAAGLHKPHVDTHTRQDFVNTNITGTLNLLEEAVSIGVGCFIFTSTTSAFGYALSPLPGNPAIWVTEDLPCIPKNIYGITKKAAEDLCELFYRKHRLPCLILRTSRFFPEEDDCAATRQAYANENIKANEFLYRRTDLEDVVNAHLRALERASEIGFGRYIISATSPFSRSDLAELREDAPGVVKRLYPEYENLYARRGWKMFPEIDRVYINAKARKELDWEPRYYFGRVLDQLKEDKDPRSSLARAVGTKGYLGRTGLRSRYPDGLTSR